MGTMQGHFFYQVEEDHCVPVSWWSCRAAGGRQPGRTNISIRHICSAATCRRRAASAPEERIAPEKPAGDELSARVCVYVQLRVCVRVRRDPVTCISCPTCPLWRKTRHSPEPCACSIGGTKQTKHLTHRAALLLPAR